MTYPTAQEKVEAIERELTMRRRVYPGLVERKKMSAAFADRQIEIFEEIAVDYRAKAQTERLL